MARRDHHYLILESCETGPWIRYECGMFYAVPAGDGSPNLYSAGEEFSKLKNAVNWLGKEVFDEKEVSKFDVMCDALDSAEAEFLKRWDKDH